MTKKLEKQGCDREAIGAVHFEGGLSLSVIYPRASAAALVKSPITTARATLASVPIR